MLVALVAALALVPRRLQGPTRIRAATAAARLGTSQVSRSSATRGRPARLPDCGTNLVASENTRLFVSVDSDSNPLTGDLTDDGMDYSFAMDNDTYWFERWDGAGWVRASNSTVRITGNSSETVIAAD